jgi:hypothetical protein
MNWQVELQKTFHNIERFFYLVEDGLCSWVGCCCGKSFDASNKETEELLRNS